MNPTLNIIGAGHVGQTLGKLFHEHQLLNIQSICNQTFASAQAACDFIGAGKPCKTLKQLPEADFTLIAVPDPHIKSVCQIWSRTPAAQSGGIIFHVSGALSSEALQSASSAGHSIASIHPLKSFAQPKQAYTTFQGTFCGVEGDPAALAALVPLFEALGADMGMLSPSSKPLYHAACVMACGGLTALYATCQHMLESAGVSSEQVKALLEPYMKHTLQNITAVGPKAALSGPVAREDWETVKSHEAALSEQAEAVQALYQALTDLQRGV